MKFAPFILLLTIILLSCSKSDSDIKNLAGRLISNSGCKNHSKTTSDKLGYGESCVEYTYNASNRSLTLKHSNATFECGAKSIGCSVNVDSAMIVITEFQTFDTLPRRNCICNYDLGILVNKVEAKKYTININEPYSKTFFDIDLTSKTEGSYCELRK